ncbi:MAG: M48 family metallopeptidase [Armatimonadetes bacterium]|nr:M48 family metallopeptidase [Armatimonadota bacterium]
MRSRVSLARLCSGLCPLVAVLLGGCANDVTDTLVERPLGALSELGVNLQFRMDDDPLLLGYTRLLGAEAKAKVHRTNVPYRFKLVDVDAPNAFAIPWGGIYVTRGLLRFAGSEDEVAFVVGHEVGHVERRHGSLAFQRNLLINVALILATNRHTEDWLEYAYLGNYFLDLHWSRQNETKADYEGVRFASMTGHDPGRGIDFFQRLDQRYGATPRFWGYFETHPINRDRISYVGRRPAIRRCAPRPGAFGRLARRRARGARAVRPGAAIRRVAAARQRRAVGAARADAGAVRGDPGQRGGRAGGHAGAG